MMEITFEMEDNKHINIRCGERLIGHIFTPGGTGEAYNNVIQVCGFEEAFDYWGCGVFGTEQIKIIPPSPDKIKRLAKLGITNNLEDYEIHEVTYKHKRDIQLIFSDYERANPQKVAGHAGDFQTDGKGSDGRCFNNRCNCHNPGKRGRGKSPFVVKHFKDMTDKLEKVEVKEE